MEWLRHSNKSTKQCDICNTAYRFRTIYDPNMPAKMPLSYVWDKILRLFSAKVVRYLLMALYVVCCIQIPLFWKLVGRVFTYGIDGKLPSPDFNLLTAALFGSYATSADFASKTDFEKGNAFLTHTFLSGLVYVIVFIGASLAIFLEHEWVVRDEGYTKMLLKKIGKEPRTNLADFLRQLAKDPNNNEGANEIMRNRALEDLQVLADTQRHEAALREALENHQFGDLVRGGNLLLNGADANVPAPNQIVPEPFEPISDVEDSDHESDDDTNIDFSGHGNHSEAEFDHANVHENIFQGIGNAGQPNIVDNNFHNHDIMPVRNVPDRFMDLPDESDAESELEPEEIERRRNIAEEEMLAQEANNGDIFELIGLEFNLSTPILLMSLACVVIMVFLFNFYLIPHMLGNLVVGLAVHIISYFFSMLPSPGFELDLAFLNPTIATIKQVLLPVLELLGNVLALEKTKTPTSAERVLILSVGYFVICYGVHKLMSRLVSGRKPVMDMSRRIYKVLFEIVATAKVFVIFAIEIVVFPVYCGWLIDFCLTPLLVDEIVGPDGWVLFFTSAHELMLNHYTRITLYWLWGTGYMLCFALFVGMVRKLILRPGVLYFIRSPEDPNARLIHDALVKSISLQLLRIYLSAKVYTAFIILGIGVITWGLRFSLSPPGQMQVLLPLQAGSPITFLYTCVTIVIALTAKPAIVRYSEIFWVRVFSASCYRLRLSHFILGVPVPQERGYVVYRSVLHQILALGAPDYSRPVSYSEAMEVFKADPSVTACFVPNGNYVRAPGVDTVTRRFLRELFVPVTKLDQPLGEATQMQDPDTDSSDDEMAGEDTYTVVYRPPNFRTRCFGLVIMAGVFGIFLFLLLGLFAAILGRPVVRAGYIVGDMVAAHFGKPLLSTGVNFALLDYATLCVGIQIELAILMSVNYKQNAQGPIGLFNNEQQNRDIMRELERKTVQVNTMLIRCGLMGLIIYEVHQVGLKSVEVFLWQASVLDGLPAKWKGALLHLLMIPWTLLPVLDKFDVPDNQNFTQWVQHSGLLATFGIAVALVVLNYIRNAVPQLTFSLPLLLIGIFYASRIYYGARNVLIGASDQIKNEKYSRGTAIENIEGVDDE